MNFKYKIYCYVNGKILLNKSTNNENIAYAFYKNYIETTDSIPFDNVTVELIYKGKILKTFKKGLDK